MPPSFFRDFVSQIAVATLIFTLSISVNAANDRGSNSFDIKAALHYVPSKAIAATGFTIYFIISALLLWRLVRNRDWWGLCLPISGFTEALGFFLRIFIDKPSLSKSLGYYIAMDFFIVLSPAAFLAFNYILYGRLIRICAGRQHSYIRPDIVGLTFVISDIITFLVQGAGGAMQVQQATLKVGRDVFLIGIVLQGVSYVIYAGLVVSSQLSVRRTQKPQPHDLHDEAWYGVFNLIYFSSLFIIIRSIYRVIETVQGFDGYLFTHEWAFFTFDSIPLAIAISRYIFHWPGDYIPKERRKDDPTQPLEMLPTGSSPTASS